MYLNLQGTEDLEVSVGLTLKWDVFKFTNLSSTCILCSGCLTLTWDVFKY